ncbi:MAG: NAD(P)-dependent oxidoreductase [Inquilinus limosus]|uniref:NAD(P)-dependent oxidoreductase n=1 Tax=Inquilinus limosus TaxID=171674 RepID=A0A952KCI5_9PROT|nr:NAD(P)-dependent oxidoreductase [Inquilinus limosus]
MAEKTRIGVVGLGSMGAAMAARLLDQGWPVAVWNRSPAAEEPLLAKGAVRAATPAEAASGGIVLSMVADDAALKSVTTGDAGILSGLPQDGVHVSMSTVSPGIAADLATAHEAAGVAYLGSPVFGRPPVAGSGQLRIAVSGPAAAKDKVRLMLETLGQVHDFGEAPEAANVVKLGGNFMIAAAIEAMAETFTLLEKHGVSSRQAHELYSSSIFAAPVYKLYGDAIVDRAFSPPGFRMPLGLKDVGLAMAAGEKAGVPLPFAAVLRERFIGSIARGRGDLDWSAIALDAAEAAWLKVD